MAIFDNNFLFESSADIDVKSISADMSVEPTMESVVEMNAELNESVYKLNTSLYIADLVMEQSGHTSLLEASVGDYFEKAKASFKQLWEKIKGFFKNLLTKMTAMLSTGKNFITKYKPVIAKINANNAADYAIYNETEGTAPEDPGRMKSFVSDGSGFSKRIAKLTAAQTEIQKAVENSFKAGSKESKTISDEIASKEESAYKEATTGNTIVATDNKECKKSFKELYTQKSTKMKNVVTKAMINDMLAYCELWISTGKSTVQKAQVESDRAIKMSINAINAFEKEQSRAQKENESNMTAVTNAVSAMKRLVTTANYINGITFSTFNRAYSSYIGLLKKFVSKNSKLVKRADIAKKESYTDSILDSIMGSF